MTASAVPTKRIAQAWERFLAQYDPEIVRRWTRQERSRREHIFVAGVLAGIRMVKELTAPATAPPEDLPLRCRAFTHDAPACCARYGDYNGYGSGPLTFTCPQHCPCHD